MKKVIKALFRKFGFEIRRTGSQSQLKKDKNNRTFKKYVEFIGPSGAGKTTILNEVKGNIEKDWLSRQDLYRIQININSNEFENEPHSKILFAKSKYVEDCSLTVYNKVRLMEYFAKVILFDLKVLKGNAQKGFFLDEGVFHNFPEELLALDNSAFETFVSGRKLIFIKPINSMTVVRQLKKRENETGQAVIHYSGLSNDSLLQIVERDVLTLSQLVMRAESYGTEVIHLIMEDGIKHNAQVVAAFEESLNKKSACPW